MPIKNWKKCRVAKHYFMHQAQLSFKERSMDASIPLLKLFWNRHTRPIGLSPVLFQSHWEPASTPHNILEQDLNSYSPEKSSKYRSYRVDGFLDKFGIVSYQGFSLNSRTRFLIESSCAWCKATHQGDMSVMRLVKFEPFLDDYAPHTIRFDEMFSFHELYITIKRAGRQNPNLRQYQTYWGVLRLRTNNILKTFPK